MTRYKGLEHDFSDHEIRQGVMHQPNMRGLLKAHVATNEDDVSTQINALEGGTPVIDEAFNPAMRHAQTFEAFTAKTIERSRSAHGVSFGHFVN